MLRDLTEENSLDLDSMEGETIRSSLPEKTHSQCHCIYRCLLRVQFVAIQGSSNQVENNINDNINLLAQHTIYSLTGIHQALFVDIYQPSFPRAIAAKVKSVLVSLYEYILLSARQEICERYFSVTTVQTGSMDNPTLYSLGTGFFPSPPATAKVKNKWSHTSASPYDFVAWRTAFPLYLYFTFMPKESVSRTSQNYRRCTTSCHVALLLITQTESHIFSIRPYLRKILSCGM